MNRYRILYLSIFLLIQNIYCQEAIRDDLNDYYEKFKKEKLDLTSKEKIIGNIENIRWFMNQDLTGDGSVAIVFKNKYFGIYASHSGILTWGTYSIENDIIHLNKTGGEMLSFGNIGKLFETDYATMKLEIDKKDFYYPIKLTFIKEKIAMYYTGIEAAVNFEYLLDNINVLKLPVEKLFAQENLKVRKRPTLDSEVLFIVKKEKHVFAYARTIVKERIDGKLDYWYYVNWELDGYPSYGWMFGGYLKDTPPNVDKM